MTESNDALHAFAQKIMPGKQITLLAQTHNTVFAVQGDGQDYLLKMNVLPKNARYNLLLNEVAALQHFQLLPVPEPISYHSGPHPHDAEREIHATLLTHLPGTSPDPASVTPEIVQRIGHFIAVMHSLPPPVDHEMALDWEGLFGAQSAYHSAAEAHLFSDAQRRIMTQVSLVVRDAMRAIAETHANAATLKHSGLLHGDLLLKNILLHEGEIQAIDFEYSGWGYYLYDLAPLLWQLKPHPRYAEFEDALWAGYSEQRALPPRDYLAAFIAARQVASLRWVAANQHLPMLHGKVQQIVTQRIDELRGFLATGRLDRR